MEPFCERASKVTQLLHYLHITRFNHRMWDNMETMLSLSPEMGCAWIRHCTFQTESLEGVVATHFGIPACLPACLPPFLITYWTDRQVVLLACR